MVFLGLISRFFSNLAAFVYPSYASYKALIEYDPAQTERWLVYWTCIGALTGLESMVSWIVVWVPFYSEMKLGFVLWLVAPQTEGSTLLYKQYIAPFFDSHEADVDATLRNLRSLGGTWLQKALTWAWKTAREQLNLAAVLPENSPFNPTGSLSNPSKSSNNGVNAPHITPIPSSMHSPSFPPTEGASESNTQQSQAFNIASNLLHQYGPMALAAGQARFGSRSGPTQAQGSSLPAGRSFSDSNATTLASGATTTSRSRPTTSPTAVMDVHQRRSALEAELAALPSPPSGVPTPSSSRSGSPSVLGKSGYEEIGRDDVKMDESSAAPAPAPAPAAGSGSGSGSGWFGSWTGRASGYGQGEEKAGKQD
ncbi:HVA22/DP1 gene product-related proteins [Phaffia rhodozyma]|uniref:Protein YOP1 n=1 Tax=Phaffia rhodozyma TaxID=264483 RepID=A0A0F7SS28_PHARH|nr:HVA22/DP1 gene product-related proteins [Phaffia rhodozyma]